MKNFIEELKWRGMLAQIMPGAEELLQKEMVTAYLGTDPTADSLHIGHLCGIMMLRHLQQCGHKPIILVGGATGMIGDPSGKSQERNLLDSETLYHNQECIKKQVSKFLNFDSKEANAAEMVNNYDWMKDFTFLDFARTVGKHITVNYMMAKDSVQQRLNGTARDGLSFTEFTYQLLQGYDFLHLYQTKNCKMQLGGNDQWGNMTTGTELIRRTMATIRRPMPSPALSSLRLTARSLARPRAATSGSTAIVPLLISSISSGSTSLTTMLRNTLRYSPASTSRPLILSLRSTSKTQVAVCCRSASLRRLPCSFTLRQTSMQLSRHQAFSLASQPRRTLRNSMSRPSSMSSRAWSISRLARTSLVSQLSRFSPATHARSSLPRVRCVRWCRVVVFPSIRRNSLTRTVPSLLTTS